MILGTRIVTLALLASLALPGLAHAAPKKGKKAPEVPVVVEPWAGFTVAEWTFSAGAGIGQVYVPGELPAFALRWQVGVGYRLGG